MSNNSVISSGLIVILKYRRIFMFVICQKKYGLRPFQIYWVLTHTDRFSTHIHFSLQCVIRYTPIIYTQNILALFDGFIRWFIVNQTVRTRAVIITDLRSRLPWNIRVIITRRQIVCRIADNALNGAFGKILCPVGRMVETAIAIGFYGCLGVSAANPSVFGGQHTGCAYYRRNDDGGVVVETCTQNVVFWDGSCPARVRLPHISVIAVCPVQRKPVSSAHNVICFSSFTFHSCNGHCYIFDGPIFLSYQR
jgi:hypothetical protein